jgi:hypothetical protein
MRKLLRAIYWEVFFTFLFGAAVLAALAALWFEPLFLGTLR